MANESNSPDRLNPLWWWTDLGLRAAEMTMASSQNMGDAADRLVRAGASVDSQQLLATPSTLRPVRDSNVPAVSGDFGSFQRTIFDLMTESWVRWVSSLGAVASVGAGIGLARKVTHQDNPLETVRTSLRPAGWGEKPATGRQVGSRTDPGQRGQRRATLAGAQHAVAAAEAKPRKRATAKAKTSRRSGRK